MTNGAAGALNTVLKAILDPGDEVIVLAPYFPEYRFYIENHGGRIVPVETDEHFQPDPARIAAAITPRTKALILNSPNNPTGVVYGAELLEKLNEIVREPMLVLSDEPYRPLTFDGLRAAGDAAPHRARGARSGAGRRRWPSRASASGTWRFRRALRKRPRCAMRARSPRAFSGTSTRRRSGNGWWRSVPMATVDVRPYQEKRDLLCDFLTSAGYDAPRPQGSYYVFPKTPIPDDIAFIRMLQEEGILAVPGAGFGRPGYMRLSLTIPLDELERSLGGFERAIQHTFAAHP